MWWFIYIFEENVINWRANVNKHVQAAFTTRLNLFLHLKLQNLKGLKFPELQNKRRSKHDWRDSFTFVGHKNVILDLLVFLKTQNQRLWEQFNSVVTEPTWFALIFTCTPRRGRRAHRCFRHLHRVGTAAPRRGAVCIPERSDIILGAEIQLQHFLQRLVAFSSEITEINQCAGSLHSQWGTDCRKSSQRQETRSREPRIPIKRRRQQRRVGDGDVTAAVGPAGRWGKVHVAPKQGTLLPLNAGRSSEREKNRIKLSA